MLYEVVSIDEHISSLVSSALHEESHFKFNICTCFNSNEFLHLYCIKCQTETSSNTIVPHEESYAKFLGAVERRAAVSDGV